MQDTLDLLFKILSALSALCVAAASIGFYFGAFRSLQKAVGIIENKINGKEGNLGIAERLAALEEGVKRDRAHSGYAETASPLKLTEKGFKALVESGGIDYLNIHKDSLIQQIKQRNPKTAYDVQELCNSLITDKKNENDFIPMKNYAYNQGVPLEDVIITLTIYLRDIALKELGFDQ